MEHLICPNEKLCSGCSQWHIPYEEQLSLKKTNLELGLHPIGLADLAMIKVLPVRPMGLRDRMDFVIEEGRFGLYSKQLQKIVDLPECLLLSSPLQSFYQEFRKIQWPIKKGSFRLRVSPRGEKGAWLDFSHLDVKALMEEKNTLRRLSEICFVEVGQRRKVLEIPSGNGKFRLLDPLLKSWSATSYLGKVIPLYSTVGSFSQTGQAANQVITESISRLTKDLLYQKTLEYGAGNGNLTFPSMNPSNQVQVIETDALALSGLTKTAKELSIEARIQILDRQRDLEFDQIDLILANPPRSGLGDFLPKLHRSRSKPSRIPKNFIYMSCFPESFFKDAFALKELGYKPKELEIIDQFPQSAHYEIMSLWKLDESP